jgi:hypothetical protein
MAQFAAGLFIGTLVGVVIGSFRKHEPERIDDD